ncbi:ABC transporter permease [Pseudonocardia sp. GCM10023141]|uniref:ABC transporter permease n=1 Tax=Pseudonocardia sp. GCM10023141 TaxID=3252653 RepID=UPI00360FFC1A
MNILESARIALRGLSANRLRSVLTTLGIVIGVAAVIVLVAFGNGLQSGFTDAFGSLANQITVSSTQGAVPGGGTAKPLTNADIEALRNASRAPDVDTVTPVVGGAALLQVTGGGQYRTSVTGTTAGYLDVTSRDLAVGRMFDEAQERTKAKVVVLGSRPVQELFSGDAGAAIGKEIRIGRTPFRVIGVLVTAGQGDDTVIMPLGAARSYLLGGSDKVDSLIVKATSTDSVPAALEQVTTILSARHGIRNPEDRDFNAQALQSQLDQFTQFLGFLTLFTGAVAGISLVVGSIGVANIMLVTVTERTREIGIRKAIGAKRRAILQQFLLESMFLSGLGGLMGIALGVGLSLTAAAVLPSLIPNFPPPAVSFGSVLLSFSISLLIGLVAGGYPANRAARLRPIEALRYQ